MNFDFLHKSKLTFRQKMSFLVESTPLWSAPYLRGTRASSKEKYSKQKYTFNTYNSCFHYVSLPKDQILLENTLQNIDPLLRKDQFLDK